MLLAALSARPANSTELSAMTRTATRAAGSPEHRGALLGVGARTKGRLFQLNSAGGPMRGWGHLVDRVEKASGVADFKWHDLRRTFMTELAEHNIGNADIVDACLNHRQSATRSGVRAAYNHATLTTQKVSIMSAWGERVAQAVENGAWPRETKALSNGVPLHAAAG
jgi:integrase